MTLLRTEWAVWGKEEADTMDYRVLTCSRGQLPPSQFSEFMSSSLTGTPAGEALPWLTFTPIDLTDRWLGISVTDASDLLDAARRPVFMTRSYYFPYSVLESAPASYGALADAAIHGTLPDRPDIRASLDYADDGARAAARSIEDGMGFPMAARGAALTIQGPVAITGGAAVTLREKVAAFDAIASLLPYGLRAGLAAATWAKSIAAHRMRLCFSDGVAPGQVAIPWSAPGEAPAVVDPFACEYLEHLVTVYERRGLGVLLDVLWSHRVPLTFEQPDSLIRALVETSRPFRVADSVRAGTATVDDVAEVVAAPAAQVLSQEERAGLLRFLLRQVDPVHNELISAAWVPELWDDLAGLFQNLVGDGATATMLEDYLGLAESVGDAQALLATTVRAEAGRFTSEGFVEVLGRAVPSTTRGQPAVRQALLENPDLLYRIIEQKTLGDASGLEALFLWLRDAGPLPPYLLAFEKMLGDAPRVVTDSDIEAFQGSASEGALALAAVALRTGRVARVLNALAARLPRLLESCGSRERGRWAVLLRRITVEMQLDPRELAKLDVLIISTGDRVVIPLAGRFSPQVSPDGDPYIASFCHSVGALVSPAAHRHVVRWAVNEMDSTGDAHLDKKLFLFRCSLRGARRSEIEALAQAVMGHFERHPAWIHEIEAAGWWWAEIQKVPSLRVRVARIELTRDVQKAIGPGAVADLYLRALHAGLSPQEIPRILAGTRPRLMRPVLDETRRVLDDHLTESGVARKERRVILGHFDERLLPTRDRPPPQSPPNPRPVKGYRVPRGGDWPHGWSRARRTQLMAVICIGVVVMGAATLTLAGRDNQAPPRQDPGPLTGDVDAILGAYNTYWDLYGRALRELDPRGLDQVLAGRALRSVRREVARRAAAAEVSLVRVVDHHAEATEIRPGLARVEDDYVLGVIRPQTHEELVQDSAIFELRKIDGGWKVVDLSRKILSVGATRTAAESRPRARPSPEAAGTRRPLL